MMRRERLGVGWGKEASGRNGAGLGAPGRCRRGAVVKPTGEARRVRANRFHVSALCERGA